MTLEQILEKIEDLIWGPPLLILLLVVGIYLTIVIRGVQVRYLLYSIRLAFSRHNDKAEGDISHFQALMTALAATIGIGSISGVATAIAAGGLGALFWMWVAAFFGMATKYAEAILAIKYRTLDKKGEMCGGPMFYIERGLKVKWLAVLFAVFGAVAAFGTGNVVQANSVSSALYEHLSIAPWISGVLLAILTGAALFGGIKSIGKVASYLVPIMGVFYIGGGTIFVLMKYQQIPEAFLLIFKTAFTGQAAAGGFLGSSIMIAVQYGVSRGIFSSEAGLGSAPIAAAAAKTDVPGRQALISMSGVFITSFIVCTITGLAIAVTGVLGDIGANGEVLNGSVLALRAFNSIFSGGGMIVTISLILFGYSTVLGWAYYGEKCVEYLWGEKSVFPFRVLFTLALIPGAMLSLKIVWSFANIMNGLMAFPNLIGLFGLAGIVGAETKSFVKLLKQEKNANRSSS